MLDKLNLVLYEKIPMGMIQASVFKNSGYLHTGHYLKRKTLQYLHPGKRTSNIHFLPCGPKGSFVKQVHTNPSKFSSYDSYYKCLKSLIGRNNLECAKINRLDIAVDLERPFTEVFHGLDVRWKQAGIRYEDTRGVRTGAYFGKAPKQVVLYDYSRHHHLDPGKITRLEVRFTKRRIPIDYITQVPNLCAVENDLPKFQPFKGVALYEVRLHAPDKFDDLSKHKRYTLFKTLLDEVGFFGTRKRLNQNNNFSRDFTPFFTLVPLEIDLNRSAFCSNVEFLEGKTRPGKNTVFQSI